MKSAGITSERGVQLSQIAALDDTTMVFVSTRQVTYLTCFVLAAFSGRGEIPHRRYLTELVDMVLAVARERLAGLSVRQGQQIWCEARADGHSPDKRDRAALCIWGGLGLLGLAAPLQRHCARPDSLA